jgi:peroxin-3
MPPVAKARSVGSTSPPSMSDAAATDDDGRSVITATSHGEGGVQTVQLSVPNPLTPAGPVADKPQDVPVAPAPPPKPRKTKKQLWDDVTITCMSFSASIPLLVSSHADQ